MLLVFLAFQLFAGGGGSLPSDLALGTGTGAQGAEVDLAAECSTGADANQRDDCLVVGVVNDVQDHWAARVDGYREADTVLFSGGVNTGCGTASSAVGPFYCPADATVYLDLGFFDELEQRFGARGGPFAQAYVIGHEYGHHVQHLVGLDEQVGGDRSGADSGAVRLELQADCFAGLWANGAEARGLIEELSDDDIAVGLDAAAAIGDDRLQERATGHVDPDSWTHGSSEQRQRWFLTGYRSGEADACDTFSGPI